MPWRYDASDRGPTRVFLVRHGWSTFNVQHRYQGRSDEPELTESGASAAALTGCHLATYRFDKLISSPLRRAHQTARIIQEALPDLPTLETSDDLRELNLGVWQGMSMETVEQTYPDTYRDWKHRPEQLWMTGADGNVFSPVRDLFEQARRFWRQLLSRHAGETILLVTHGGTARALISTVAGISIERFHSLQHSNLGISILEFPAGSSTARIEALNLTGHLGEPAPKLKQGKRGLRAVLFAGDQPLHAVRPALAGLCADFSCSAPDEKSKCIAGLLRQPAEIIATDQPAWWEHTVQMRLRDATNRSNLTTGVFIAPESVLSSWLADVLLITGGRPWKPFGAAVLHYPGLIHAPVIQTIQPSACEEARV